MHICKHADKTPDVRFPFVRIGGIYPAIGQSHDTCAIAKRDIALHGAV